MSLQIAAQHLARKGRGPDTELVHMTKGEIGGLQALALSHGGSLTTNPDTGLVEAGFLSKILPMLAAAGAIYATGGAAGPGLFGMGAAGTGALAGGLTGALVNPNDRLMGGIMGGMGGYGVGGIADGLSAGGGMAGLFGQKGMATNAMMAAAPLFSADEDEFNVPKPIPSRITPFEFARNTDTSDPLNPRVNQYYTAGEPIEAPGPAGYPYQPGQRIQMAEGGAVQPIPTYDFTRTVDTSDPLNPRVNQAFTKLPVLPPGGQGIAQNIGGGGSDGGYDNTPDAWSMLSPAEQAQFYAGNPTMAGITQMGQKAIGWTGLGALQNYMNPGFVQDQQAIARGIDPAYSNPLGGDVQYGGYDNIYGGDVGSTGGGFGTGDGFGNSDMGANFAHGGPIRKFNAGGISTLGSYSDGGQLTQGPGDGMSDSIPAQIGQDEPAALADAEFVFPADVVSHFGNGSSNAGAKYLYKVMDDIRMARTGRKAQGTEIAPEEYLTA